MRRTGSLGFHVGALALVVLLGGCQREGTAWCHQFVDAYAEWMVGCGFARDAEEAEALIEQQIRDSTPPRVDGCEDIWGIRDRVSFRDECLPTIRTMSCDSTTPPPSCRNQLLYE
jgi:hypothetical protein